MKKFFMIAVMAVAALTANAQLEKGHFMITPYIGTGYGNLSNQYSFLTTSSSEESALSACSNLTVGADFQYNCSSKFGISLGLGYQYAMSGSIEAKGIYIDGNNYVLLDNKEENKFGYLNIPVLAHVQFTDHFSAKAGVMPAILTNYSDGDQDAKDLCNSFALSIPVGIAWKFNSPLELGLQCNIPVTKFYKSDFADFKKAKYNIDNSSYLSVMLTLGWRFEL